MNIKQLWITNHRPIILFLGISMLCGCHKIWTYRSLGATNEAGSNIHSDGGTTPEQGAGSLDQGISELGNGNNGLGFNLVAGTGQYGSRSGGPGCTDITQLNEPRAIVVDPQDDNTIYFNEMGCDRVQTCTLTNSKWSCAVVTISGMTGLHQLRGLSAFYDQVTKETRFFLTIGATGPDDNVLGNKVVYLKKNTPNNWSFVAYTALQYPYGLEAKNASEVYITSGNNSYAPGYHHLVNKWIADTTPTQNPSQVNSQGGHGTTNGDLTIARFNEPRDIAFIGDKIFVADSANNAIRLIDGITVSTYFPIDVEQLASPGALAAAPDGKSLLVADTGYHRVVQVTLGSPPSSKTIAGTLGNPGVDCGEDCRTICGDSKITYLKQPDGIAVNSRGHIFISDTQHHCVRRIIPVP